MGKEEIRPPEEAQFRHMTWTDRLQLEKLFNQKNRGSYRAIARELGFSHSSVYDEVQHGLYEHRDGATWEDVERYSAQIAQDYSELASHQQGHGSKAG